MQRKNARHRQRAFLFVRFGTIRPLARGEMSIEAVIFDMGGVIMRTEDLAPRTALAERLGTTYQDLALRVFDGPESRRAQIGEIRAAEFWRQSSALYGMTAEPFMAEFFKGDIIDHELVNAIRGLQARYKTALLSNAFDDLRYWVAEDWKIADAFHTLVISAEVKMMKPDPAIYAHALKEIGTRPEAAVFIDDLPVNIAAAQQAGMHGIVFKTRQQALAELSALLAA
jgi:epoxide hydrolase-like predicted phosphatase